MVSILDDIKISENFLLILTGFLSGLSLTFLFTLSFLNIFSAIAINKTLLLSLVVILFIYVFYDMMNPRLIEVTNNKNKNSIIQDLISKYLVDNSIRNIPLNRQLIEVCLRLLSRIIAPLTLFTVPKFSFETILVYKNNEVDKLFKKLHNRKIKINLKYLDGEEENKFFLEEGKERISVLLENTPKENFPYIFNIDYSFDKDKNKSRKWIAYHIIDEAEHKIGYIFIHKFKGVSVKRKIRNIGRGFPIKYESRIKTVYLFILIGEEWVVNYLKNEIETLGVKFDLSYINIEQEI